MSPSAAWLRAGAVALWVAVGWRQLSTVYRHQAADEPSLFPYSRFTKWEGWATSPSLQGTFIGQKRSQGGLLCGADLAAASKVVVPFAQLSPFFFWLDKRGVLRTLAILRNISK